MSASWLRHGLSGARFCGECALLVFFWLVWLGLGVLLVVQIGIAFSNELAVPDFLLRSLEERLAASHLTVKFGHAAFDPTGRVLIENVRFNLPEFEESVATARSVYVELDPWSLLVGRFEPERVRVSGLNVFVPAMLAPSGRNEEVLHELEILVTPGAHEVEIEHFAGRVGGVPIDLHGRFALPRAAPEAPPLPIASLITKNYAAICRHLVAAADRLALLEEPSVNVTLTASTARGALAQISVVARSAHWPGAHPVKVAGLRAWTRLPVLGEATTMAVITAEADEVQSDLAVAHGVRVRARGALQPATPSFEFRGAEIAARDVIAHDFRFRSPLVRLTAGPLPRLKIDALATYSDLPLAVEGDVDLKQRRGVARLDALLSPTLVDVIGKHLGRDLRRFIDFGAPAALQATATFADGWNFSHASGRFAATKIDGYGVVFDSVTGEFEGDRRHLFAHHLIGHVGQNFARGSYEHEIATRNYRFLLEGRLRPMEIGPWFHEWWPNFFRQLEFPDAPPEASVDVSGRWGTARESRIFVQAESARPVLRGVKFDYARTLLFIRPNFFDGLELVGTRGPAELRGTFQRHVDFAANEWQSMDVDFFSTLDLETGRQLLGPVIGDQLTPFAFERPPTVIVRGHFDGPAAPGGPRQQVEIDCDSTGAFALYGFPFRNLGFLARLQDGDLTLTHVEAAVAQGSLGGKAKLWTADGVRRLGFDATLRGANLAEAVATVETFAANRRGESGSAGARFLAGKSAIKIDATLSAEGEFAKVYSYQGTGNALLTGAELGEVRLLGGLSQLLNFASLRFTSARTDFQLAGNRLVLPNVNIAGANSAIEAHGSYALDLHQLDFNARVFPFRESKSFLQSVVGTILTPISSALEVKLTGPLDHPEWSFVMGPTNLLRSLGAPDKKPEPAPPGKPAASPYLTR